MFDNRQTKAEIIRAAGVQNDRLIEALIENNRLREELRGALCPGGGYTDQPRDEYPDVAACLKAGVCGCSLGAALAPNQTGGK